MHYNLQITVDLQIHKTFNNRQHIVKILHTSLKTFQLYSAFTGSYVPGHHSVLLINSPNEQANKLLHIQLKYYMFLCFFFWSFRYFWKGEIQDASEFLMVVKTKTSRTRHVIDYVRSVHPYANPEVLSFPVEDGSLAYMKWMDEAIPDD
uniref:Zgc:63972 n=1 Tax=Sphaeramia orbicularis TaxID=375764 RepID=A0A673BCP7_9TELE